MAIKDWAIVCPHLGIGAYRCVWAVGYRLAFKYEYAHPVERYSNKKEVQLAGEHPEMLALTLETVDGRLLAHHAADTIEHLMEDMG